jgi:predicted Zn finger-like uncharacterized protein
MIVICTRCHAKFRVADEKVGPRGVKVRCSKCQTVFMVHRDLGTVPMAPDPAAAPPSPPASARPTARLSPALDVDLEPAPPRPPPLRMPAPADPFGCADPFASSSDDPFAPGAVRPPAPASGVPFAADPFAPDPFAAAAPSPDPRGLAADPFGLDQGAGDPFAGAGDPFQAEVSPSPARANLPVTDLSALLGTPRAPAAAPPARLDAIDFSGDFDPGAGGFDPGPGGSDLALEDRTTPPALAAASAPREPEPELVTGFYSIPSGDRGEPGFAAAHGDSIPLATEPTLAPSASVLTSPAAARRAPPAPRAAAPSPPEAPDRIPGGRSPLRAAAVNAVALAALLLVALAIRVVWHGEGTLAAGGLRPAAIASALGKDGGAFPTSALTNGVYERATGAPLLWVKGRVTSRAPGAVAGLTVTVEVLREGHVIARGTALAGAVPAAEELHAAGTPAALEALAGAIRRRAPPRVRPGDEVAFLVAVSDAPDDLAGAALRVKAEPRGTAE